VPREFLRKGTPAVILRAKVLERGVLSLHLDQFFFPVHEPSTMIVERDGRREGAGTLCGNKQICRNSIGSGTGERDDA